MTRFRPVLSLLALPLIASPSAFALTCSGTLGPNILGAKGTFSAPFIAAAATAGANQCIDNGNNSYSPAGNLGQALPNGYNTYTYTGASGGLQPEGRYSILKIIGDASGGNCIKPDWRGQEHTGDGGWYMTVNGAPNQHTPPTFYKINGVKVCPGATYEFSSQVLNTLPANSPSANPGSEPNISFRVNGSTIATSGPIAYQAVPSWVHAGGVLQTAANQSTIDLEVRNATQVAAGNDLGLDDISLRMCGSLVSVAKSSPGYCEGSPLELTGSITDNTLTHSWYKWQLSIDGGQTFVDLTAPAQGAFAGNTLTASLPAGTLQASMTGYYYRLVAATSLAAVAGSDECVQSYNDYLVTTPDDCSPLPITVSKFSATDRSCRPSLSWTVGDAVNFSHFEVQTSTDGSAFAAIGQVAYRAHSTAYEYLDAASTLVEGQRRYYRLALVDLDGKREYSAMQTYLPCRAKNADSLTITAFPNPVVDRVSVEVDGLDENSDYRIRLFDSQGRLLRQETIAPGTRKARAEFDASRLPSGVYQISVGDGYARKHAKISVLH